MKGKLDRAVSEAHDDKRRPNREARLGALNEGSMPDSSDTTACRYNGGVFYRMRIGGDFVSVRVNDEALDDCEQSNRMRPDRLAVFGRNRYSIERVARRKHIASLLETDGSILIGTSDLNG